MNTRLHRLRNAVRSESYERKTAGGFITEMLGRYGLKADVEDFGPEAEVSVHHLESDWDFLMERAKRYGRSVYEWEGTVYVRNEITVSQEDIVLEYGKSIISFRVKESLAGQVSKCTYTGWNMMKCEGVTGSAEIGEVAVKAGGGRSWAEETRVLPGQWKSVIDSKGVADADDARQRALGDLQNTSMEWQRAEVKCEGDCRLRPGMRVTLKYIGERFSGEYVAERVNHELGADGFITEVFLRRNMLPGEPKKPSAVDEERERRHNSAGGGASDGDASAFHIGQNMDGETEFVYQDDYGNLTDDPYAVTGKNVGESESSLLDEIIRNVAESHLDEPYGPGNMCDDFAYKILNEAGISCADYFAGKPSEKTVKEHIVKAKQSVHLHTAPVPGANIVFMGDGTRPEFVNNEHCGLLFLNEDGSVNFYHNSRSNTNGGSTMEEYDSVSEFEAVFIYSSFYYLEI